jgi:DNA-binding phage protein
MIHSQYTTEENAMISNTIRKGIKIALIQADENVTSAAKRAGIGRSSIYRFCKGSNDINVNKLDAFCNKGLGKTLAEILELGK